MPVTPATGVFPDDTPFSCGWSLERARGAPVNVGWTSGSAHVGTHVDAPYHVLDEGARVGGLDLDAFIGRCHVIDARGRPTLDVDLFEGIDIRRICRILFRTQDATDPARSIDDFPTLTTSATDLLRDAGVRLLGIDAPSFDPIDSLELPIHQTLARAGIANIENLVLDDVSPGEYEFLGAPLNWPDMDAAPLRAILRR